MSDGENYMILLIDLFRAPNRSRRHGIFAGAVGNFWKAEMARKRAQKGGRGSNNPDSGDFVGDLLDQTLKRAR
jgi:hypothetical protein